LLGARGLAGLQMAAREAGDGGAVVRLILEDLAEDGARRAGVARLEEALGLGQGFGDLGGTVIATTLALEALDEGLDLALGQGADEAVDHATARHRKDGG